MDFFDEWWTKTKGGAVALYDDLKELANPITSAVTVPIDKFKEAARKWLEQYNELLAIPDSELTPELLKEKNSLVSRGQSIISKSTALGFGVDNLSGRLGYVPIVVGGTVVAIAGIMIYWQYDYIKFQDAFASYKSIRKSGGSHEDALDVMTAQKSKSALGDAEKIAKYAMYAGAGYFAYKLAKQYKVIK